MLTPGSKDQDVMRYGGKGEKETFLFAPSEMSFWILPWTDSGVTVLQVQLLSQVALV